MILHMSSSLILTILVLFTLFIDCSPDECYGSAHGTVITSEILNDRNVLDRTAEKVSIDEDKNTEIVGLWTTTIMMSS